MAKKTFANFIKNYSSNPELHRKVFKAGGVAWEDIKDRPSDYYAANTGSVPGMIYYADTTAFAKKNVWLILSALFEFESECGELTNKQTDDETQFQNWLVWFAWENMMSELISYIENED